MVHQIYNNRGYSPEQLATPEGSALINETYRILAAGPMQHLTDRAPADARSLVLGRLWQFSGFKTDQELREAGKLLLNPQGDLRPFNEFKRDIRALNDTYNVRYLRAEYTFVQNTLQAYNNWHDTLGSDHDAILQYRTMEDARVRESHQTLNNTTLPKSDPFWAEFYPPNGWGCRCFVKQVRPGKYPLSDSAQAIQQAASMLESPKQKIFRFNPGKSNTLVPPKHPYLPKGCGNCPAKGKLAYDPTAPKCQACDAITQARQAWLGELKQAHNEVMEWLGAWPKGHRFQSESIKSGAIGLSSQAAKNCLAHANTPGLKRTLIDICNNPDELKFVRFSPLGEGKNLSNPTDAKNVAKKTKRRVTGYNKYRFRDTTVLTEVYHGKEYESPYTIDKIKKRR